MFGTDAAEQQKAPEAPEPQTAPEAPARGEATGTVPAATTNPYASPGVPVLPGEDSTVDFHAAFEVVIEVDPGVPIADPLAQLGEKERATYRGELEDVINAQRYGRSLGAVSRHCS